MSTTSLWQMFWQLQQLYAVSYLRLPIAPLPHQWHDLTALPRHSAPVLPKNEGKFWSQVEGYWGQPASFNSVKSLNMASINSAKSLRVSPASHPASQPAKPASHPDTQCRAGSRNCLKVEGGGLSPLALPLGLSCAGGGVASWYCFSSQPASQPNKFL